MTTKINPFSILIVLAYLVLASPIFIKMNYKTQDAVPNRDGVTMKTKINTEARLWTDRRVDVAGCVDVLPGDNLYTLTRTFWRFEETSAPIMAANPWLKNRRFTTKYGQDGLLIRPSDRLCGLGYNGSGYAGVADYNPDNNLAPMYKAALMTPGYKEYYTIPDYIWDDAASRAAFLSVKQYNARLNDMIPGANYGPDPDYVIAKDGSHKPVYSGRFVWGAEVIPNFRLVHVSTPVWREVEDRL